MTTVAIIGAGPRGTAALSALANTATEPIKVHLFGALDENGKLIAGEGTPFSRKQPVYSRLNARSEIVDQFGGFRNEPIAPDSAKPSGDPAPRLDDDDAPASVTMIGENFDEWASEKAPEWVNEFPPRAVIGEYMVDSYLHTRANLPECIELHEHAHACKVSGEPGAWRVTTGQQTFKADELLLAVGHAKRGPDSLEGQDLSDVADSVYPYAYPVSVLEDIKPGATVAVRGAGLTFIDIALALTEGRGGKFSDDGTEYTHADDEVETIYPLGLEGIFLDVKPDLGEVEEILSRAELNSARAKINSARKISTIMDVIRELTEETMEKEGYANSELAFDAVIAGSQPSAGNARATLAEALGAFKGERKLTTRSVFAGVVLKLYGEIVERVSGREWEEENWEEFASWIALVNSYGSGPPPINAQKMLTLIDAGIIDCSWLDEGVDAEELPEKVDALVDAVLAPSGYWPEAYPELEELDPYLGTWADPTVPTKRSGVRTDTNASVLDKDAKPIEGLAAVGRITDDWILGLDSLNLSLHPHIRNWAQRVTGNKTNA